MRNVVLLLALGACARITEENVTEPEIRDFGSGQACSAAALDRFVGQPATSELAAAARTASGAVTVRWLRPGQVVTMEFREDRLNIHLDGQNRVTRLACG